MKTQTDISNSADSGKHGRIARIESILGSYAALSGSPDDSIPEMVADILADLRHYCDSAGLDFAELDRLGYRHYLAEKQDA